MSQFTAERFARGVKLTIQHVNTPLDEIAREALNANIEGISEVMVPTVDMDQTVEILGQKLFSPIIAGPMAQQQRFHPDGELATVKGAAAAKTVMVVSSDCNVPLDKEIGRAHV